ncbi:Chromate resistance protein ChrB [Pseudonocardia sp. GCM10023141]|uniref:Chromate resistance protein ChrB n=1 Tax=Pseudonocardia sp. GCM10023141 TaxID=3252653 RepID=UPI003609CB7F
MSGEEWVLLCYRVPREPSTPRIAVWRRLKRLGVAQIGDGVVALPADARTREQLEWVADDVEQVGGSALLWTASPTSATQARALAEQMRAARVVEYTAIVTAANLALADEPSARTGVLRRLRSELRRVERRDYFPAPNRDDARTALQALAESLEPTATPSTPVPADTEPTSARTVGGRP